MVIVRRCAACCRHGRRTAPLALELASEVIEAIAAAKQQVPAQQLPGSSGAAAAAAAQAQPSAAASTKGAKRQKADPLSWLVERSEAVDDADISMQDARPAAQPAAEPAQARGAQQAGGRRAADGSAEPDQATPAPAVGPVKAVVGSAMGALLSGRRAGSNVSAFGALLAGKPAPGSQAAAGNSHSTGGEPLGGMQTGADAEIGMAAVAAQPDGLGDLAATGAATLASGGAMQIGSTAASPGEIMISLVPRAVPAINSGRSGSAPGSLFRLAAGAAARAAGSAAGGSSSLGALLSEQPRQPAVAAPGSKPAPGGAALASPSAFGAALAGRTEQPGMVRGATRTAASGLGSLLGGISRNQRQAVSAAAKVAEVHAQFVLPFAISAARQQQPPAATAVGTVPLDAPAEAAAAAEANQPTAGALPMVLVHASRCQENSTLHMDAALLLHALEDRHSFNRERTGPSSFLCVCFLLAQTGSSSRRRMARRSWRAAPTSAAWWTPCTRRTALRRLPRRALRLATGLHPILTVRHLIHAATAVHAGSRYHAPCMQSIYGSCRLVTTGLGHGQRCHA
jgi:hypothetical protein